MMPTAAPRADSPMATDCGLINRPEVANSRLQPLQSVQQAHSHRNRVTTNSTNRMMDIQTVRVRLSRGYRPSIPLHAHFRRVLNPN